MSKLEEALDHLRTAVSLLEEHSEEVEKVGSLISGLADSVDSASVDKPRPGSSNHGDLSHTQVEWLEDFMWDHVPLTKEEWQAAALAYLIIERKAADVVAFLQGYGFEVSKAAVYKWLRTRAEREVVIHIARGYYQLHPTYRLKAEKAIRRAA
jgi:hypothetical protein